MLHFFLFFFASLYLLENRYKWFLEITISYRGINQLNGNAKEDYVWCALFLNWSAPLGLLYADITHTPPYSMGSPARIYTKWMLQSIEFLWQRYHFLLLKKVGHLRGQAFSALIDISAMLYRGSVNALNASPYHAIARA